jgi:hypothetical protein
MRIKRSIARLGTMLTSAGLVTGVSMVAAHATTAAPGPSPATSTKVPTA